MDGKPRVAIGDPAGTGLDPAGDGRMWLDGRFRRGLEEAGLSFSNVVGTNVYLDSMDEFSKMNSTYASYFGSAPPTRTTLQPAPPVERKQDTRGRWPMLEQISLIAVR